MASTQREGRYLLRGEFVAKRIADADLYKREFADQIGYTHAYVSKVMHGHLPAGRGFRRAIVRHPIFVGVDESMLWDVKPPRFEQMPLPCVATNDADVRGVA